MMKQSLSLLVSLLMLVSAPIHAQTVEELKATQAEKQAELDGLQAEINSLQKQIDEFPGWKTGAFGLIGVNLSNFTNWYSRAAADPANTGVNTSAATIGVNVNGFANLDRDKSFWRNSASLNMGWVRFRDKDDPATSDSDFQKSIDVFNLTSLYGYKLSDKWALSALGEYRTTFLSNFNDPGYLDIGIGATWTPVTDLVVVFHPLNYNIIFAENDDIFQSSLGCKIVADYTRELTGGISWRSNLSAFLSYEDMSNLSNWTWVNGLGFKVFNGIGVGFELGLRGNKMEAANFKAQPLESAENDLQSYWLLGLTYSL